MLFTKKILLECPSCKSALPITRKQLKTTTTKCKACHKIFKYSDQLEAAGIPLPIKEGPDFIPVQKGLEMRSLTEKLEIVMQARDLYKKDPTAELIILHVFLLLFSYLFITEKGAFSGFYFVFLIPFFLWAFKLLFEGLIFWFNSIYLTVNKEMITVEHAPINFLIPKDRHLMVHAIDQLFIQKNQEVKLNKPDITSWTVNLKMKDGEVIQLINELGHYEDAQFIEKEINKYLGIEDALVLKKLNTDEAIDYKIKLPSSNDGKKN